jgi:hypothetical protein
MALATAWCNGRDQGQARVGIFGFFVSTWVAPKFSCWNIAGNIFRRGVTEERKKLLAQK